MFQSSPTSQGGRYPCAHTPRTTGSLFQSSPTSQGGRYSSRITRNAFHTGFNPRPPRKVGATREASGWTRTPGVSILAHLARWALHETNDWHERATTFQSSPTSQGGRYHAVPPLPPPETLFQSSPTSQGGRYRPPSCLQSLHACFNPRPPRKVGATRHGSQRGPSIVVSILAHLARWALPPPCHRSSPPSRFQSSPTSQGGRYAPVCRWIIEVGCFNPRPPRKVGATIRRIGGDQTAVVSILAHLARWALPARSGDCPRGRSVSILAHLARWALRMPTCWGATCSRFQSSPTSQGGRYRVPRGEARGTRSFNPRPPRKVGATKLPCVIGLRRHVSILAHLARWALLPSKAFVTIKNLVSILAHLARWALLETFFLIGIRTTVSILAHLARWALLAYVRYPVRLRTFQSSPTSQGGRYTHFG